MHLSSSIIPYDDIVFVFILRFHILQQLVAAIIALGNQRQPTLWDQTLVQQRPKRKGEKPSHRPPRVCLLEGHDVYDA